MDRVLYCELNIFCMMLLFTIAFHTFKSDKSTNSKYLITLMISEAILFLADTLWVMIEGNDNYPIWMNYALNALYFSMTGFGPFIVLRYYYFAINGHEPSVKMDCLSVIPAAFLIFLAISAFSNNALFYVDKGDNYFRGQLYFLQPVISFLYVFLSIVYCIYAFFTRKSFTVRRRIVTMSAYLFFPSLCGVLEIIFANIPIMCVGITFSLTLMSFKLQQNKITHDALTQISNRESLLQYLEQQFALKQNSKKSDLCLAFIDADNFKTVNDRFGHAEGDNALCVITKGLKDACRSQSAYCARYAGDEFVIVFRAGTDEEAEAFNQSIKDCVVEAAVGLPYELRVSSGWARYVPEMSDPHTLIKLADSKMYENKKYGKDIEI